MICCSAYSLKQGRYLSQSRYWSSVNCGIEIKFKSCMISFFGTLGFSENKFLWNSKSSWLILTWHIRFFSSFVIFRIVLYAVVRFFSRLTRKSEDFSSYSYLSQCFGLLALKILLKYFCFVFEKFPFKISDKIYGKNW